MGILKNRKHPTIRVRHLRRGIQSEDMEQSAPKRNAIRGACVPLNSPAALSLRLFSRRPGFRFLASVIFIRQYRWANLLLPTLVADHANQVGTGNSQVMLLTKSIKLLQMNARHDGIPQIEPKRSPITVRDQQRRIHSLGYCCERTRDHPNEHGALESHRAVKRPQGQQADTDKCRGLFLFTPTPHPNFCGSLLRQSSPIAC
jgi:hypothetical protein